jgi:hypothetical protein
VYPCSWRYQRFQLLGLYPRSFPVEKGLAWLKAGSAFRAATSFVWSSVALTSWVKSNLHRLYLKRSLWRKVAVGLHDRRMNRFVVPFSSNLNYLLGVMFCLVT